MLWVHDHLENPLRGGEEKEREQGRIRRPGYCYVKEITPGRREKGHARERKREGKRTREEENWRHIRDREQAAGK